MMRWVNVIVILMIMIIGISFASLNHGLITINYYFNQVTLPVAVLIGIAFSLGCLVGVGIGLWWLMKNKIKYFTLKRHCQSLEKKIQQQSAANDKETVS